MESTVYNKEGKSTGKVTLPEAVFGLPWNADLVHQVVTSLQTAKRTPVAHTKTRGEVRGGGKKPWKQKGTGQARHGSTRSPIWVGGGITHGPRNDKNFDRKVNKKMKQKALLVILSKKHRDGEVMFIDDVSFTMPKTKEAKAVFSSLAGVKGFERLGTKKTNALYMAMPTKNRGVEKSFGNFSNVEVADVRNMNPLDVLQYKFIAFVNPKESVAKLTPSKA